MTNLFCIMIFLFINQILIHVYPCLVVVLFLYFGGAQQNTVENLSRVC